MPRAVYVYRLVVTLPEGSDAPGWRPEEYDDQYGRYRRSEDEPFCWPKRRLYLSSAAAYGRKYLLERWGATVTVERSLAVAWEDAHV